AAAATAAVPSAAVAAAADARRGFRFAIADLRVAAAVHDAAFALRLHHRAAADDGRVPADGNPPAVGWIVATVAIVVAVVAVGERRIVAAAHAVVTAVTVAVRRVTIE